MVNQHICGDVEFCFYQREAQAVFLCGDFNGWHQTALPMTKMDGGWWNYRLHLGPGCYQFKYLAGRDWYLDYAAFGLERGPLGSWNSVVLVRVEPGGAESPRVLAADRATPRRSSLPVFRPHAGSRMRRRRIRRVSRGVGAVSTAPTVPQLMPVGRRRIDFLHRGQRPGERNVRSQRRTCATGPEPRHGVVSVPG